MYELLAELLVELLPVLVYGTAALLMTGLGVLTERGGLAHLANGDGALGLWMVVMGAVFLYFGVVLLGYERFLERARRLARDG
jgi:hypothetical protein